MPLDKPDGLVELEDIAVGTANNSSLLGFGGPFQ